MKSYLLSVILPVFNVEKYLINALNSAYLCSEEIEYIIIDDASTDNSLNVINDNFQNYENIRIFQNKTNMGYGYSCNLGISLASGTYLAIFEPDDLLFLNFYIHLIIIGFKTNADIVKYNGLYIYESLSVTNRKHYISSEYCNRLIQEQDILIDLWKKHPAVFNGIYKKEWINKSNIRFVETPGASYQDVQFSISLFYSLTNIYIIDETHYYYRQHVNQSIANADNKVYSIIQGWNDQLSWLTSQNIKDGSFFIYCCFRQMLTLVESRLKNTGNKITLINSYKNLIKTIKFEKIKYNTKYFNKRELRMHNVIMFNHSIFFPLLFFFKYKGIVFNITIDIYIRFRKKIKSYISDIFQKLFFRSINEYRSLKNINFENHFKNNTNIDISIVDIWENYIKKSMFPLIRLLDINSFSVFFPNGRLVSAFSNEFDYRLKNADLMLFWGLFRDDKVLKMLEEAEVRNIPRIFMEDGLIRSITPTPDKKYPLCYKQSLSLSADIKTPSFDVTRPSMLEDLLNSEKTLTDLELQRAKLLIDKIITNHITKYNHQPIIQPVIGSKDKKKVLVVDQAFNDWSIVKGAANERTFIEMLDSAISENTDADIIIKIHPDMIADKTRGGSNTTGYYGKIKNKKNLYICSDNINPISLINYVDKVYVCSSQMGFEALMCGKEVVIFGAPFYAGWGVGDVRNNSFHLLRRKKKRSVEEIFYFMYLEYTKYINPELMRECQLEDFIDIMIKNRDEFFKKFNIQ